MPPIQIVPMRSAAPGYRRVFRRKLICVNSRVGIASEKKNEDAAENEQSERAGNLDYARDDCAVTPGSWIVVIAVKNNLIGQRADLVLGGLN